MKYICLGYIEPAKFENMSESERNAMVDDCLTYDEELRKKGHFVSGEALQPAKFVRTVSWKGGKVAVTDGPFAETKEQLGGMIVLEARDLDEAVQLISQHPGVRNGPFEVHPVADFEGVVRESEQRRKQAVR